MRIRKMVMTAGMVVALGALMVTGTALAQTPAPGTDQQAGTTYQEYFLDRLSSVLGIGRDTLEGAIIQARNETVDLAVADGRLSQERADAIKAQEGVGRFGFGVHGFDRNGKMGGHFTGGGKVQEAIAGALGITTEELHSELRSGKTITELAAGNEQAVKDAVVRALEEQLDGAVQSGRISREEADQKPKEARDADLSDLTGRGIWGRGEPGERRNMQDPGAGPSRGLSGPSPEAA